MLNLGFTSMLILYGVVAGCGYFYWGCGAHELVTLDLQLDSPLSDVSLLIPGLTLDRLVSACILVNALTTYPSLLMVIQVRGVPPPRRNVWSPMLRTVAPKTIAHQKSWRAWCFEFLGCQLGGAGHCAGRRVDATCGGAGHGVQCDAAGRLEGGARAVPDGRCRQGGHPFCRHPALLPGALEGRSPCPAVSTWCGVLTAGARRCLRGRFGEARVWVESWCEWFVPRVHPPERRNTMCTCSMLT